MIIRVTTLRNHTVHIPAEAATELKAVGHKLCKAHGFRFMALELSESKVTFDIEIQPKAGDLGALIGAIKSVWSRLLMREYGVPSAAWVPRYLIMTITPPDAEAIEQEWIEKVTKAFAKNAEPTEEPTNDAK
ncbi:hypothetical protein A4U49_12495 [Acidithiobacillus ferrivorans]|uniref:hypothetical protein n=1 Tax=Acidithiobacillus ferrivorans TaxID=160808 RepID=UPI0008936D14|nr:hypothetical protein [Acidithiobacillus ferrivorans]OFA15482.1 hypothetical protein A4U49_12495 [Acidithiobacillus ferrivorans]